MIAHFFAQGLDIMTSLLNPVAFIENRWPPMTSLDNPHHLQIGLYTKIACS